MKPALPNLSRELLAAGIAAFSLAASAADPSHVFAGEWSNCGGRPCDEAGGFSLRLAEDENEVWGTHFVSTPNAGQLDEGDYRSVQGTVRGRMATVSITSGRDNAVLRASVERRGNSLIWKIVQPLKPGNGLGNLIPESAELGRYQSTK